MYRSDGYRVSTDDPMYEIAAYVMDKRYDASNSIKQYIDYAPLCLLYTSDAADE